MTDASLCAHQYRRDVEPCPWCDLAEAEERTRALEQENESLKEHGRRYFDLFEQFKAERARLRRMILDMRGCLDCGCWEREIQALKEEPCGD